MSGKIQTKKILQAVNKRMATGKSITLSAPLIAHYWGKAFRLFVQKYSTGKNLASEDCH